MAAMDDGRVHGTIRIGQNPATSLNGPAQRRAMRKLDWLVVKAKSTLPRDQGWKNLVWNYDPDPAKGRTDTSGDADELDLLKEIDGVYTNDPNRHLAGFFIAGYTGVLISVTNRPIGADSSWSGALYLFSAASSAAVLLILLARRRRVVGAVTLGGLEGFDRYVLLLELLILIVFLASLGSAARVFLSGWVSCFS